MKMNILFTVRDIKQFFITEECYDRFCVHRFYFYLNIKITLCLVYMHKSCLCFDVLFTKIVFYFGK